MPPRKKLKVDETESPAKTPKSSSAGPMTRSRAEASASPGVKTRRGAASSSPKAFNFSDPEKEIKKIRKMKKEKEEAEANRGQDEEVNPGEDEVVNPDDDGEAKTGVDGAGKSGVDMEESSDEDEEAKSGGEAAAKSDEVQEAAAGSSKGKGKAIEQDGGKANKNDNNAKAIRIRYNKDSDRLFKAKADEIKAALETGPGYTVKIDKKIKKNCFEVREEGGPAIIQLMDMEEPYKELQDVDPDTVVAAAIAQ